LRGQIDCLQKVVELPTPLGGEAAALLRARQPDSPLLRKAKPYMEGVTDSRIATSEAFLALQRATQAAAQAAPSSSRQSAGL
jgi:hypothetical protein